MDCPSERKNGAEWIVGYATGILPLKKVLALEQHMETCERCRSAAAAQRKLWSDLDSWQPIPVSPDFDQRLYQRIEAEARTKKWWSNLLQVNWSWKPAMPVAAVCVAVIAAFLLRPPGPGIDRQAPVLPSQAPRLEELERALEDMDMLKQIAVPASREAFGPSDEI